MATCAICRKTILFGGIKENGVSFCSRRCREKGAALVVAPNIPDDVVTQYAAEIHRGPCPKCQRAGPVDLYTSYSVWSAIIITRWESHPEISCLSCGNKAKIKATTASLLFGWWGFPFGLIITPIQLTRNIWGLICKRESEIPSEGLKKIARVTLAAQIKQGGPKHR